MDESKKRVLKRVTYEERKEIESLLKLGLTIPAIADKITRPFSTVCHEVRRGTREKIGYTADEAHRQFILSVSNSSKKRQRRMPTTSDLETVKQRLTQGEEIEYICFEMKISVKNTKSILNRFISQIKQPIPDLDTIQSIKSSIDILQTKVNLILDLIKEKFNEKSN